MVFVDSIYDLAYYTTPAGAPCYCEQLAYPSDLQLQGMLPTVATSGFDFTIEVLSADGVTTYEDATAYFTTFIADYQGTKYFGIKLNSYSPAMCTYLCWILRIRVSQGGQTIFDKYTQRYCQTSCCDVPRNITFQAETVSPQALTRRPGTPVIPVRNNCSAPLIRIETAFDCVDNQSGEFYGAPNVLQGTGFTFQKITNIAGRIVQRPREIKRQVSYNCNLQRSESFKPYLLESTSHEGVFPMWKLNELENMLHASTITVSDVNKSDTYQFDGGAVGIQPYKCWELFRLQTTLRSCTIRQTFGCSSDCSTGTNTLAFVISPNYQNGPFFTEDGQTLANYPALLDYYRTRNGVAAVDDITDEYPTAAYAFEVTGNSHFPTSFYFDRRSPRNKVFGTTTPVPPVVACTAPLIETYSVEPDSCTYPTFGTISVEPDESGIYSINGYGDWVAEGSVTISGGTGLIALVSRNNTLALTSPLTSIQGDIIAIIPASEARPANAITISHEDDGNIPDGAYISIDTYGSIRYYGYATYYDGGEAQIELNNVYYNI